MSRVDAQRDAAWRERAADAAQLARALAEGEHAVQVCREDVARCDDTLRRADLGRALQRYARDLELAGREGEAEEALREALGIWQQLGRASATYLVSLRLAELVGDVEALRALEARAVSEPGLGPYADSAAIGLGCALARAGEISAARAAFLRALAVRKARGVAGPVAAVEALLVRLEGAGG